MTRPVLSIVAGSNGCGKTSLTGYARSKFQQIPVLDPDAIAKSLQETASHTSSDVSAGKEVLRRAAELIVGRQSFTVETTLSGSTYLKMAVQARDAGFNVLLFFIGTSSVEINLQRVRARVKKGGHDVPEEDQRRRYPRTLSNLYKLFPIVDMAVLFDNSSATGHILVGVGHGRFMHWIEPVPEWAQPLQDVASPDADPTSQQD